MHTLLKKEAELDHADLARSFVDAVVEVLVAKCALAMQRTGLRQLVVAGGVGANRQLRAALDARNEFETFYPEPELCTDNGAMIASPRLRLGAEKPPQARFWRPAPLIRHHQLDFSRFLLAS